MANWKPSPYSKSFKSRLSAFSAPRRSTAKASIPLHFHPAITDTIAAHAHHSTLLSLRATCRELHARIDSIFAHHIVLEKHPFCGSTIRDLYRRRIPALRAWHSEHEVYWDVISSTHRNTLHTLKYTRILDNDGAGYSQAAVVIAHCPCLRVFRNMNDSQLCFRPILTATFPTTVAFARGLFSRVEQHPLGWLPGPTHKFVLNILDAHIQTPAHIQDPSEKTPPGRLPMLREIVVIFRSDLRDDSHAPTKFPSDGLRHQLMTVMFRLVPYLRHAACTLVIGDLDALGKNGAAIDRRKVFLKRNTIESARAIQMSQTGFRPPWTAETSELADRQVQVLSAEEYRLRVGDAVWRLETAFVGE